MNLVKITFKSCYNTYRINKAACTI